MAALFRVLSPFLGDECPFPQARSESCRSKLLRPGKEAPQATELAAVKCHSHVGEGQQSPPQASRR